MCINGTVHVPYGTQLGVEIELFVFHMEHKIGVEREQFVFHMEHKLGVEIEQIVFHVEHSEGVPHRTKRTSPLTWNSTVLNRTQVT